MSVDGVVLFGMVIAIALSPFIIVFQVTRLAHSSFRNKLWIIRDNLVDDLRLGRVSRSEGAEHLLRLVQTHIDVAGRHTFADTLLGWAIYRSGNQVSIYDEILGTSVPPSDRQRLTGYLRDLRDASISHLSWASPTGWIVLPLIRLAMHRRDPSGHRKAESDGRQARQKALRNDAERVELEVMPKLMPKHSPQLEVQQSAVLLNEVPC